MKMSEWGTNLSNVSQKIADPILFGLQFFIQQLTTAENIWKNHC